MSSAAQRAEAAWSGAESYGAISGRRYRDRDLASEAIKILPGEFHVTDEDIVLVTLLGSCVSACLRDPLAGVGGINHFMLPEAEALGGGSARYGAYAMEVLINELLKRGARRDRLEAKVFGGGNVIAGMTVANVGARNASFALRYLEDERIRILAQDLGGVDARKLGYFPRSGRVLLKHLPVAATVADLAVETAYGRQLQREQPAGDVELF
ncbi:chemoreceptor glutamine deamidase CheD [Solimonas terrae]|uniref:Probable chemoreceptor glutamine deamidase CheD n=1 Tax=Solimonas terrae TaxID=1396819 RepID=A0A6M2BWC6_9GAMM|nr:chemoreceptor glutamine deamidase CheD [Solimonas terrae]